MEIYILDALLRRVEVVDRYESMVWAERWAEIGDFEIDIRSSYESRAMFKTGTKLAMSHSLRVMTVETVLDKTDANGVRLLNIKGPSIEDILDDRAARPSNASLTTSPTWDIVDEPAEVIRKIVRDICITGTLNVLDKIPYIFEGRHPAIPASNIPEPIDPIGVKIEPKSVYEAIKDLANTWTLGFRLLRNDATGQLYFDVYSGVDRTASQLTMPPVLFSPDLENLQNTSALYTIDEFKNVALVIAKNGSREVFPDDVDPLTDGFARRVLVVQASDIELPGGVLDSPDDIALRTAMIQRGKEALAEHRAFEAFDGEISQRSQYLYGIDYDLGDLVETRNSDGVANQMRVIEQIFVSDREGERAYPTLALNTFINTGSWLSWPADKHWADYDADLDTVWASLP